MATLRTPLIRPKLPALHKIQEYFLISEKANHYTNFGPCYDLAVRKLKNFYPQHNAVLTNNGTTALQAALQTTFTRGSRIALPSFTFTATLNAVLQAGLVPVFFDINPNTWCIDRELLIKHVSEFDGILVVSPFGYPVDIKAYDSFADDIDMNIVYDFAPAFGHELSKEHLTSFSFHATKQMPIGEGGAVMIPNLQQGRFDDTKALISFDFDAQKVPQSPYGFNGKLDELHCATLCVQLDNYNSKEYNKLIHYITDKLNNLEDFQTLLPDSITFMDNPPQLLVLNLNANQMNMLKHLSEQCNFEIRRYYEPWLHEAFPQYKYFDNSIRSTMLFTYALPYESSDVNLCLSVIIKAK